MSDGRGVAVVIPTLDGGPRLLELLDAVRAQEIDRPVRIVAIDSGSTDGTVAALETHGATVLRTDRARFSHGATRNHALAAVHEEYAALLVQDAVPASPRWLAALLEPLVADARVAGSYARQRPWPDATETTKHYLAGWAACGETPIVRDALDDSAFAKMTPRERHDACIFDNVSSCIRMSAWRAHPFEPVRFAEDLGWALQVLRSGYRVAFVPEAVVWHSHDRSVRYELQRTYLAHARLQTLFGLSTVPTGAACARAIASSIPLHVRLALREPRQRLRHLCRGLGLAVALPYGQYLGARAAREGRELMRVAGV